MQNSIPLAELESGQDISSSKFDLQLSDWLNLSQVEFALVKELDQVKEVFIRLWVDESNEKNIDQRLWRNCKDSFLISTWVDNSNKRDKSSITFELTCID